jgi:ribosome-binding protein aMBF1 (putative translation factor)
MGGKIFTNREVVKRHELAVEGAALHRHAWSMPNASKDIGKRLIALRHALGLKAVQIAKSVDCKPNRWSQYETGERPLTLEIANRLVDEYGVTLDWLYRGDRAALRGDLREKLPRAA